jgi:hypothetical protein
MNRFAISLVPLAAMVFGTPVHAAHVRLGASVQVFPSGGPYYYVQPAPVYAPGPVYYVRPPVYYAPPADEYGYGYPYYTYPYYGNSPSFNGYDGDRTWHGGHGWHGGYGWYGKNWNGWRGGWYGHGLNGGWGGHAWHTGHGSFSHGGWGRGHSHGRGHR